MAETATIELLTATVRTLMIGSKQVTLSVAKQLDFVELTDLKIFGRVKISTDADTVVGVSVDGNLVLAKFSSRGMSAKVWIGDGELPSGAYFTSCGSRVGASAAFPVLLNYKNRDLLVHEKNVVSCGQHIEWEILPEESRCGWQLHGCAESVIDLHIEWWDALRDLHESAKSSPLIVLAGLR